MNAPYDRRLDFEGAANFRDLGGYPAGGGRRTRWRRLFRADSLGDLTEADLERLDALGLRGLIDFRIDVERRLKPNRLPRGSSVRTLEIGFLPVGTLDMLARVRSGAITTGEIGREVAGHYRLFVADHAEEYRKALAFAADPDNYPLLIHCTSGKDRTGFASAVLLLAVGVPREVVLQDYDLTNRYRRDVSHLFGPKTSQDLVDLLLSAQTHYLEAALDEIDRRFGSFDGYLAEALEIDDTVRARLYDLLTEA
jgi:protein-tyrosine phosphatase